MDRRPVSLALLPFQSLSDSVRNARLARGFEQDLIAELSRFPDLGVIAADSTAHSGNESTEQKELARRLGAQFLIKGSLRSHGKTFRLSLQLVEAESGHHLWAGRYDEEQFPQAQDEIAVRVANALAINVDQARMGAARRRHIATLEAYDSWLLGLEALQRGTPESDIEARHYFERSIEADPHFARGHSGLSLARFNDWSCQAWTQWEETEKAAYAHALRAEALDPDDATVQVILARIEQYRRQFDCAAPRLLRARTLAPNDARVLIQLAFCHALDGDSKTAWETAQRALALNPFCPVWYFAFAALPLFMLKRFREALEFAYKAPPMLIVDLPAYKAAAHAHLGELEQARSFLEQFQRDFCGKISPCRKPDPDEFIRWLKHVNPYRRQADIDLLVEGLHQAGLKASPARRSPSKPLVWPVANVFRAEGKVWTLAYEHEVAQLPPMRGLQDIAKLLARPHEEITCVDLDKRAVKSEGIPVLDETSKRAYRRRLAELETEIEEAGVSGNIEAATRLDDEREAILQELKRASGIGGRVRETGATHERARSAVTWRIRHAIKKIAQIHPSLGSHLANSIHTGSSCAYHPERPMDWQVNLTM